MMDFINIADIDPSEDAGGLNLMVKNIIIAQCELGIDSSLLYFKNTRLTVSNKLPSVKYENLFSFIKTIKKNTHYIFHSVYNVKYMLMMFAIRLKGGNYSIHSHGSLSKHCLKKSISKKIYLLFILRFMLIFSKKIIFSNNLEFKNSIISTERKVIYIPNLIDGYPFHNSEYREKTKIIYIGKIDYYYKGIENLIIGISRFFKSHSNYSLDIYGFGNKKNINIDNIDSTETDIHRLLYDIEKYNLGDRVKFKGPILSPEIKIDKLNSSGLFILTSNSEAMPLAISEALSCGLPVIASTQTNMSEYISQYNAGVPCKNTPDDIFTALEFYNDTIVNNYEEYNKNARSCFEQELSSSHLKKYVMGFAKCLE